MCLNSNPGVRDPLRDRHIEHSKLRFGDHLIHALGQLLRRDDLDEPFRVGLLRFAGHLGDSKLGTAVAACWSSDTSSEKRLGAYLWAFARTCEAATVADYLEPVCAAWAALPENGAVDDLCRAFQRAIPHGAIDYLIERAQLPDLQWRFTYMLHAIDDPRVISFIVTELARQPGRYANNLVSDHWRRAQELDRRMSAATRRQLLGIWQDKSENPPKRVAAFDLWAATQDGDDLPVLQAAASDIDLADQVLAQRRDLGDRGVVPDLVKKIRDRERGRWWWFHADRVWTSELAETLDYALDWRRDHVAHGQSIDEDHSTQEIITRLPRADAEGVLLRHWDHLKFSPLFVQAALYIDTPTLREVAAASVAEAVEPASLFKRLSEGWHVRFYAIPALRVRLRYSLLNHI